MIFDDLYNDFYDDRFNIIGWIDTENTDGSTDNVEGEIAKDIICKISYQTGDRNDSKSIDGNFKKLVTKIFTNPTIDIKKGDKVIASKIINDRVVSVYEGIASEPMIYSDHLEFILEDIGAA
ncbi:MAG: hypothetical protein RR620_12945 [Clostridium sp.]